MQFIGFQNLLPKIAEKETRFATIRNNKQIPDGDYAFIDVHCADKTCDCRRVFINVQQVNPKYKVQHIATISYGWESLAFYRKWGSSLTKEMVVEFKGPVLDRMQQQSSHAPLFLEFFKNMIATEPAYVNRLKNHYALFKWRTGMKLPKDVLFDPYMLCPCGSEKKYKFCCGNKNHGLAQS
jgi:SEC-C motif